MKTEESRKKAGKIVAEYYLSRGRNWLIETIADAITAERKEAWDDSMERIEAIKEEHQAIGYRGGLEQAAMIVEAHRWDRDKVSTVAVIGLIVNAIRAKIGEVGK